MGKIDLKMSMVSMGFLILFLIKEKLRLVVSKYFPNIFHYSFFVFYIDAEVEILVASNLRPVSDKPL